jgi:hypothetical protein
MLVDGKRAWRRPRTDLRFAGQIGEIAGLSAKTGIAIRFHRSHIVSEVLGSRWSMQCQSCGETKHGRFWLPRVMPNPAPLEALFLDFAREHLDKGCRVYGLKD